MLPRWDSEHVRLGYFNPILLFYAHTLLSQNTKGLHFFALVFSSSLLNMLVIAYEVLIELEY